MSKMLTFPPQPTWANGWRAMPVSGSMGSMTGPTWKCERLVRSSGVGSGAGWPPGSHARIEYESHAVEAALLALVFSVAQILPLRWPSSHTRSISADL